MHSSNDPLEGLLSDADKLAASLGSVRPNDNKEQPSRPGRLFRFWRDDWGMDVQLQPHAEIANFVDEALGDRSFSGDQQTLIMLGVPRGTYKTTGVSEATPVEILTRNPDAKILLDGYRHGVAKARLRAIRRKIENDDALDDKYNTKAWKPQFRSDTWNSEEIIIQAREDLMSREASIATAGVDRSMNSQHFDVIIPDDVVTDTNCRTAEGREQVYQHIADLLPILNPGGVLILVFTTWHIDDAYMRLIRIDEDRVRRGLQPQFKKLIRGAYDGPGGSLYFPPARSRDGKRAIGHSYEFLEDQKERMGSHKFAAQYLLKPVADEDKTFKMDAVRLRPFKFFTTYERPLGGVIRLSDSRAQLVVENTIAWDPAGRKQKKTSDSHGITVVGTDVDDTWWILEALGLKASPAAVIDRMCRLIQIYRPWCVSIEDTFGSGLWIDMLADECARRGIKVRFDEYQTGNVPKEERIELMQPRWERGGIVLRANESDFTLPAHINLYNQFDKFTKGGIDHEDELDSLVQHMRLTRKPEAGAAASVDENPEDPEYAAFRERQEAEKAGNRSRTGRFGPVWTPGGQ